MDILLIAGLWLDASVWYNVAAQLEARGHRAVPVTLPGQGDGNASAALADQVGAAVAAVDAAQKPLVVGHSAACSLAWLAAGARPPRSARLPSSAASPPVTPGLLRLPPRPGRRDSLPGLGRVRRAGLRRSGRRREAGHRGGCHPGPRRGHARSDQAR